MNRRAPTAWSAIYLLDFAAEVPTMAADRSEAERKAARSVKLRAAGKKAALTRQRREVEVKEAAARKVRRGR